MSTIKEIIVGNEAPMQRFVDQRLDSTSIGSCFVATWTGTIGEIAFCFSGVGASGASFVIETCINYGAVSPVWTVTPVVSEAGSKSASVSVDGNYYLHVLGKAALRIRTTATGSGTCLLGLSASSTPETRTAYSTPHGPDIAIVTTGGTSVVAFQAGHVAGGGLITNDPASNNKLSINIVGEPTLTAAADSTGTTFVLDPGQSFIIPPSPTTVVRVNAADSGHAFSGLGYY